MFPNIFCPAEPQITDADLDRPAKDLPLEAIYQLGLKLHDRHATCGDWANLAELLGYCRDKIDEFENQSVAERRSASFLMLKDWTKHTAGRSLYVLRESLRRCRREDCVLYLDQKVIELSSMQLHVKLIDDTFSDSSSRFMTITTRCDATLRESLENLLGGSVNNFEIDASWNEKASNFKGRHLSIRRSKRPNIVMSSESDSTSSGEGPLDKMPYNDLSGKRIASMTASQSYNGCRSVEQDTLTRRKVYLSEECIYCGKFRTITRMKSHPSSAANPGETWQDVGVNYSSCQCNGLNFDTVVRSRDVNISDDELVTSSTDSQPRAIKYLDSLQRVYKYPGNSVQTLVKVPVGQHIINGNTENQQQTYMLHNVYMTSDVMKQHVNFISDDTPVQDYVKTTANQNFDMQTLKQCLPSSVSPTGETSTRFASTPVHTVGYCEQTNPRERSSSEPAPFTKVATLKSPLEFGGTLTKQMLLEEQKILSNSSVDSPKDTIGDIFSKQFADEQQGMKKNSDIPPKLPPRNYQKASAYPSQTGISQRKVNPDAVYTLPGESQFQSLCSMLKDVPGWWPSITEATVEESMSFVCKEDGHYMIWYMRSKDTLVLSVSHLSKIIHYAFYTSEDENGQMWYYIFPSKSFKNLKDLINHHIQNGLDPQAQQPQPVPDSADGGSFISQQNVRQSRRLVRMLHVRLRYPITDKYLTKFR